MLARDLGNGVIVKSVACVSSEQCVAKDLSEYADEADEISEGCRVCREGICLLSIESGGNDDNFILRAAAMLPVFDCSITTVGCVRRVWISLI